MLSEKSKEIRRHAVLGGAIAAVLAFLEQLHKLAGLTLLLLPQWVQRLPKLGLEILFMVMAGVLAFSLGFGGILWLERRFSRKALVLIPKLNGYVDGRWINAVVHNGTIVGASLFTIESSVNEGFAVNGETFKVSKQQEVDFGPTRGRFDGKRGFLFGPDGISYVYEGAEHDSTKHFGVVYYRFARSPDEKLKGLICLEGAFLANVEQSIYHVCGRRVEMEKACPLPECDVRTLIRDWVVSPAVKQFRDELLAKFKKEALAAG